MRIKVGKSRAQTLLFPPSLEQIIDADNVVRLIDAFIDILNLEDFDFVMKPKKNNEPGAPQYAASDLLKLYLYGYLNRTTSSRQLEKLCKVNIEVMWLLHELCPAHMTINNFRKDNPKGLKKVFRFYNRFLDSQDLFGKKTIAIDGSKFRAQNSKKNNHNEKSLRLKEAYQDMKTEEYLSLLDKTDNDEDILLSKKEIKNKLKELTARKQKCKNLKQDLAKAKENGELQISTVDKDARKMRMPNNGVDICLNVQSAVDDKHSLIADFTVTNKDDKKALSEIAIKVKEEFEVDSIDTLADAGYFMASELKKCSDANIITYVSPHAPMKGAFSKQAFKYDATNDTYTCPNDQVLTTNGNWLKRKNRQSYKKYNCSILICEKCPFVKDCLTESGLKNRQARTIERMEFDDYVDANNERIKNNKSYYRKRAKIVEHPFGTIKRNWGYTYSRLRGLEKIEGEFSLIFLCYNIRRSVSILGVQDLIKALKAFKTSFLSFFKLFLAIMSHQIRFNKKLTETY